MSKIIPIKDLRNTNEISKLCKETDGPIFITKNGYSDLVIMSNEYYNKINPTYIESNNYFSSSFTFENQDSCLGYIKVASINFQVKINHITHNANQIIAKSKEAYKQGAKVLVFPELAISGYSCGDMFLSNSLLKNVDDGIKTIANETSDIDAFITFGAPLIHNTTLYNTAVCMHKGKILGVIAKSYIPNYDEFYEKRYFSHFNDQTNEIYVAGQKVAFGNNILFQNTRYKDLIIGVEICEDMWINIPRSSILSDLGATIICNLSSSNETLNKNQMRLEIIKTNSYRSKVGYIYSSSSISESSADVIFSSHNIICEPDGIIKESDLFDESTIISEIDLDRILTLKRKQHYHKNTKGLTIPFSMNLDFPQITRTYSMLPFINRNSSLIIEESLKAHLMQAKSLIRRLKHINCENVVIGISGGLDSTIALLATVKAFDLMNISRKNIHAITLPCFGTTKRTKDNASLMCEKLKVNLVTIDIEEAVKKHLKDINVSMSDRSITFENAQARERTQVLMDYSNKVNGIVIGTGDLSEIALGWSTYNGDHMSMYNLNCSLPKTFLKAMIKPLSEIYSEIKDILLDILNTPISPELLPSLNDEIVQVTEDVIGPYELHDFYLYHFIYHHLDVIKVYEIAKQTFNKHYTNETIKKWFIQFIKRFFNNQFKRSCSPDGPKISEVSLSPRGDFRMPSDASGYDFINQLENYLK